MAEVEQPQAPVAIETPAVAPELVPEVAKVPAVATEVVSEPTEVPAPVVSEPVLEQKQEQPQEQPQEQQTEAPAAAPTEAAPEKTKAPVVAEAHLVDTYRKTLILGDPAAQLQLLTSSRPSCKDACQYEIPLSQNPASQLAFVLC